MVGQWTQRLMDAVMSVVKPFVAPLPPEIADLFVATLDGAILCLVLVPNHEQTRGKVWLNVRPLFAFPS